MGWITINKLYKEKQTIISDKEVNIITTLNDYKIAYSSNKDKIINILGTEANFDINRKVKLNKYNKICKLENHFGKVNCICKLNQDLFASGGGDILSKNIIKQIDHNIYIWKPVGNEYNLSQRILGAHEGDVNSIILLRDGRFASSSKDRTIKIWKIDIYNKDNKINFILNQHLDDYLHGLYRMIQLDDDRIVSSTSDKKLVFWNNTDNIF